MKGFLRHIKACNPCITEKFLPLMIDGNTMGWLRPTVVEYLKYWPGFFKSTDEAVMVLRSYNDFQSLTWLFSEVVKKMAKDGLVNKPINEAYPITADDREAAVCTVDRVAAAVLGLRSFGQHLNGYVKKPDGLYLWIATRSNDRLIFPGYLDNMVAGGLPWGVAMEDNLVKEGLEEANLPIDLSSKAIYVNTLTYNRVSESGFRPDTLYCYDLELPESYLPVNTDGEVESFALLPVQSVYDLVLNTDRFKLNCNLVIIDFLIRHGLISSDDPSYVDLVSGLRQPLGICT